MEQGYIEHRAALNDCYALDRERLQITVRTGYDVTSVNLCYGDPFSSGIMGGAEKWQGAKVSMEKDGRLKFRQLWTVTVKPEYKRCKYYFELSDGQETVYLLEDGCCTEEKLNIPGKKVQYFFFPWMNESDLAVTPDWAAETVWYQIFPDRFRNGGGGVKPPYTKPWKSEKVQYLDVYGGDINGIREKLPYLAELGITGIYLTPVFASKSNHKYNTSDYYQVDPAFGTGEELKKMVEEAHAAGIRVMLDAVFNHSGTDFAPWRDVLEKGPESEYFDWFFVHKWPFDREDYDTRDGKYDSFAFHGGMPKLNTNNDRVKAYFTELCSHWLRDWGIDGIRFDVGNEVAHSFLKYLRRELKKINPDVYLLGEIWHDSALWLTGDEYDSVMNYPFAQSVNDFFIDKTMTAEEFEYSINRCTHLYYRQVNRVLFNLLDSHDTDRLYTRAGDLGTFYQQLALLFTMEGSPCIFYGTEIAMEGGHDPDCRRCMPWDRIENGACENGLERMKRLIRIRKDFAAARSGDIVWKNEREAERVIRYEKWAKGEKKGLGVLLNASQASYAFNIKKENIVFSYGYEEGYLKNRGTLIFELCY